MTELDVAWLAGLLEGEGCFGDNHQGGVKIQLTMTDRDVVERVASYLGSKVYCYRRDENENHKPRYYTQIGGQKAVDIMCAILPQMGARRGDKIRSLLDYRSRQPGRGWHRNRTHCPNGHLLDGVTVINGKRIRRCLTCHREREAARRQDVRTARMEAGW